MIYTSYFASADKVPHPIAIARGVPSWFKGEVYEKLAPSLDLLKAWDKGRGISQKEYTERYLNELAARGVTVESLKEELPDECTLLCWETPLDFCHRHIVAWVLRNAGVEVKEWEPEVQNAKTRTRKKSTDSKPKKTTTGKRGRKAAAEQPESTSIHPEGAVLLQ